MNEKDKKNKKDNELKHAKTTEKSVEVGYVQEQIVQNVSELKEYDIDNNHFEYYFYSNFGYDKNGEEEYRKIASPGRYTNDIFNEIASVEVILSNEFKDGTEYLQLFSIDEMRKKYNNGSSLDDIYNDMITFIKENKDSNPDAIQYAISQLISDAYKSYDHCIYGRGLNIFLGEDGYHREHLGDNSKEILQKVLDTPDAEELHGLVCSTIAEFGMRLLGECDIKAVMLSGGTDRTNHTTLLWQRSDGKYVQQSGQDYDNKSYLLNATNIKDAAREVYHKNLGLLNNGYIYFVDNDGSYQEFAMKDEAVWGNELDKRDYNNLSVFDHAIADKSNLQGNVTYSNLGSISAEVKKTTTYSNDIQAKETSFSFGYKKSGITSLADSSFSVGTKIEHKTETLTDSGKKFYERKFVADYTQLHTNNFTVDRKFYDGIIGHNISCAEDLEKLREFYSKVFDEENKLISEKDYINFVLNGIYPNGIDEAPISYISEQDRNLLIEDGKKCYLKYLENYNNEKSEYIDNHLNTVGVNFNYDDTIAHPVESELQSFDTSNLTLFLHQVYGKEKTLLNDDGTKITNGYKLSGNIGLNDVMIYNSQKDGIESVLWSFGGDVRLAAEEGLKLDLYDRNSLFSTAVSGGITADMSLKSGTLTPTVSPGIKLNGSSVFQTRISDNTSFGANLSGYSVVTKPSIDYGASGQVQASYRPNGSNLTLFGSANYGIEQQRIRIGGFNEQTENLRTLGVSVGAQIGQKAAVSLNYNGRFDKLNSTRDRSTISVGARINL